MNLLSGFAFDSTKFATQGDLPVVRIRDVVGGSSLTFYSGDFDARYIVEDGDLLIGMDGNFNRGTWRGGKALLNQRVCRIVPRDTIDPRFLYHYLPDALQQIEDETSFATVKHLSASSIREIRIPLPPLPEQRRIASILDQADELRSQRRQALALLEKQAESEFRAVIDRAAVGGWPTVRLGDVADLQGGLQVSKSREVNPLTVPYLRVANVYRSTLNLSLLKTMQVTEAEFDRVRLAEGDLLLVEGHGNPLEVGRAARWSSSPSGVVHQNHLIRARAHIDRLNSHYLEALLNSSQVVAHWRRVAKTTSGLNTINMTDVREVPVLLPPLQVQRTVAARLGDVAILRRKQIDHLERLDELFASLQHRAFRGEL